MPQLLTGGNRPPLWPGGPTETLSGTPDPNNWGPFVVSEHLNPPVFDRARSDEILGKIADLVDIVPPSFVPSDSPQMN